MTSTDLNERRLRKAVAQRARELGHRIRARVVELELPPEEVAPGCRVFRAWWGPGERGGAVSGLLEQGQAPDTWPQRALGKLFRRWLDRDGELPDPAHVAQVAAYLYDPLGRKTAILSPADLAEHRGRTDWSCRGGRGTGCGLLLGRAQRPLTSALLPRRKGGRPDSGNPPCTTLNRRSEQSAAGPGPTR